VRRQLNTLYVTTEGAWLHKDGANIVMEVERKERARLPVHMLESLVCFGRVLVSPPLLGYCAEQGICTSFLTPNGRFLARVEGPVSGNVLLGKLHNQRAVLGRALRDHGSKLLPEDEAALTHAYKRLDRIADKLMPEADLNLLRGYEGEAAQAYFGVFDHLIRVNSPAMRFKSRSRRPPLDAVNALLSFLYTLVTHDCRSALESVGLDPAVGFLHRDRPGRPSLALDLLEEFRPLLADRLALSLINRKQVGERDFQFMDNGAVLLTEAARKTVLTAYQERKREELRHVFI
jgi:CRISPR-associated protein Cas1